MSQVRCCIGGELGDSEKMQYCANGHELIWFCFKHAGGQVGPLALFGNSNPRCPICKKEITEWRGS